MARSKKRASKKGKRRQASKATRAALTTLRKQGLISKSAFKGRPGGSAYKQINKYRDVIEGRAVAVKLSTRLIPKRLASQYKMGRGKMIVPKPKGTIRTTIKRGKTGAEIVRTRRTSRGKIVREKVMDIRGDMTALHKDKIYRVTMPNWRSESYRYFTSQGELRRFLDFYDNMVEWLDIAEVDFADAAYDERELA